MLSHSIKKQVPDLFYIGLCHKVGVFTRLYFTLLADADKSQEPPDRPWSLTVDTRKPEEHPRCVLDQWTTLMMAANTPRWRWKLAVMLLSEHWAEQWQVRSSMRWSLIVLFRILPHFQSFQELYLSDGKETDLRSRATTALPENWLDKLYSRTIVSSRRRKDRQETAGMEGVHNANGLEHETVVIKVEDKLTKTRCCWYQRQ